MRNLMQFLAFAPRRRETPRISGKVPVIFALPSASGVSAKGQTQKSSVYSAATGER